MGFFTRNQKGDEDDVPSSSQAAETGASGRRRNAAAREESAADDLRRRARRRLVGAIAMVLIAVVVLPMVLDGEGTPPPENVPVAIPSQNTPFQPNLTATAPVAPPTPIGADGAPSATPDPAQPAGSPDAGRVGQDHGVPGQNGQGRVPASIATITPLPGQENRQMPPTTPTTPAEPRTPPANTPPATPSRTTPPAPPPTTETRPQPNAAAAQKEAEAARALALLQGKPVPPASASGGSSAAAASNSSRFAVQVVAVRSREGADALLQRLRGAGLTAYIESINTPDGQVHRVRLGPFNSRSQAESAQAKLRSVPGGYSGSLVPL
ncbi:SPOR domain-containing protein [Achromobacter sp. GG226]|uniref:SPOR domain-containing protein n=1 Tax=Verticiella alkaliphila TaxID=2779529 RepID=UPI001C0CC98F|nr:SPOR domain-containing protein [Verticiella sp. GG226]MBU4610231.1 SPOR domain-containing protein [Verticiella sp. GG226]